MRTTAKYMELLQRAEEATNRKDAIYLINEADKVRQQMRNQELTHPVCHG